MIGLEARTGLDELQKRIMRLEKTAFERGIAELKMPGVEEFEDVVSNSIMAESIDADERTVTAEKKPSLLIIDDDLDIRTIIREYFEPQGFDVIEAVNSEKGIECQFKNLFDVIIVEILLPGTDGIDTILAVKEKFPDVKIIAMTRGGWYGTDIDFDMAEKLGALTIHKPFLLKNLETMVNGLLNGKNSNE